MLSAAFALKLFEGFSIERWNDLARPFALVEMDKAGEKMVLAYIIGKYEEQCGKTVDWHWMIYAAVFDLFKRIALCDIKSPVQRMIRSRYPDEYKKLNAWVLKQYEHYIGESELFDRFRRFLQEETEMEHAEPDRRHSYRVLRAAHKFATLRELQMLSVVNEPDRVRHIEHALNSDIQEFLDLRGLQLLVTRQSPYEFLKIIEQLRFQTRWNQTPRVPRTSVLGHSFYVAVLTLLLGLQQECAFCAEREYNNFFSALFHDLPEAVTRDIISPVKQATYELPAIVKKIEDEFVSSELRPLMDACYAEQLLYFTQHEFENRIRTKDGIQFVEFADLNELYNSAEFSPVDGRLIRCADHIAAFIEADCSIKHGITSVHLRDGRENILKNYPDGVIINGFAASAFFSEFM